MPLKVIHGDITKIKVDVIVNSADNSLLSGGTVHTCIHRVAGHKLTAACRALKGCGVGNAKITKAYRLPCKYVIHTVAPHRINTDHREIKLLSSCYTRSLNLAKKYKCHSIAFPLISSGQCGYPKKKAFCIAKHTTCL